MNKILILIILYFPIHGFSQMVVSDPVMASYAAKEAAERSISSANVIKQLNEAYRHTQELTKTAGFLKKNYDRLTTVNEVIRNLSRLEHIVNKQQRLIKKSTDIVTELETSDLYTLEEVNSLHGSLTNMINNTNDIISMLDLILKPKTSMSDGERLELLRQMEDDFKERQALMDKTIFQYTRIRNQRMINKSLKAIHLKQ